MYSISDLVFCCSRKRKELVELHEEWRSLKDEQMDNYRLVHTPMPKRLFLAFL